MRARFRTYHDPRFRNMIRKRKKKYRCPYCGKEFSSKQELIEHICKKHKYIC